MRTAASLGALALALTTAAADVPDEWDAQVNAWTPANLAVLLCAMRVDDPAAVRMRRAIGGTSHCVSYLEPALARLQNAWREGHAPTMVELWDDLILEHTPAQVARRFCTGNHRFVDGRAMDELLAAIQRNVDDYVGRGRTPAVTDALEICTSGLAAVVTELRRRFPNETEVATIARERNRRG